MKRARLLILLFLGGCTYANKPLNDPQALPEARVHNHTRADVGGRIALTQAADDTPKILPSGHAAATTQESTSSASDGFFVGLALSGGGSRSANFSAACMFELERIGLLQRVDYISSVSGGSLPAAYYCSAPDGPDGWNPANVQERLTHSFATDLYVSILEPWNLLALMFTDKDRSDLLAESFRSVLFTRNGRELTFNDLRPDRPRLLLNATDLQSGRGFIFCNESFDELNSDLSRYPLAYGVAASAAVPVILHQVTLRDFSTIFKQYRHLIDGGITDNLGIVSLLETYDAQVRAAESTNKPDPYPNGVVLFVVDAHTKFDARLSDKGDISLLESLAYGASLTSTALLNRASSATLAEMIVRYSPDDVPAATLRKEIKQLEDQGFVTLKDRHGKPVRIVSIALSRLSELNNVPFASFSEHVNSIQTYFNIDPTEAYNLYKAAELLMRGPLEKPLTEVSHELQQVPTTMPTTEP